MLITYTIFKWMNIKIINNYPIFTWNNIQIQFLYLNPGIEREDNAHWLTAWRFSNTLEITLHVRRGPIIWQRYMTIRVSNLSSFGIAKTRFWRANTSPAAFLPASTPEKQYKCTQDRWTACQKTPLSKTHYWPLFVQGFTLIPRIKVYKTDVYIYSTILYIILYLYNIAVHALTKKKSKHWGKGQKRYRSFRNFDQMSLLIAYLLD